MAKYFMCGNCEEVVYSAAYYLRNKIVCDSCMDKYYLELKKIMPSKKESEKDLLKEVIALRKDVRDLKARVEVMEKREIEREAFNKT